MRDTEQGQARLLGGEHNEGRMNRRYDMKNVTIFAAIACALSIPLRFWGVIKSIVGYERIFGLFGIESGSAMAMYFRVETFLGYGAGLISSFAMLVFFIALIKRQK